MKKKIDVRYKKSKDNKTNGLNHKYWDNFDKESALRQLSPADFGGLIGKKGKKK